MRARQRADHSALGATTELATSGSGIEATRAITAAYPSVAVLVLTMSEDADAVFGAIRAGARGDLLKGADREELLRAIRAVAEGEAIFGAEIAERLLGAFAAGGTIAPLPELTDREREVLALVTDGYTNSAIAQRLVLSDEIGVACQLPVTRGERRGGAFGVGAGLVAHDHSVGVRRSGGIGRRQSRMVSP